MARIGARCEALRCVGLVFALSFEGSAAAEHAPPPPIVLEAAPAPELPSAEFSRHPLEFTAELAVALPSCADGSVDNQRCDAISAGLGVGGTLLWRPTPYFALGGTFNTLRFGSHPGPGSALGASRASGYFVGALGRVYFFERGIVEPYLELGFGSGGVETRADEAGEGYEESSSGLGLHTGGGLEFYLSRQIRLGPAFNWTTFDVSQVRRCGDGGCETLNPTNYGHGTGFSSFAIRLSIVLGPGL